MGNREIPKGWRETTLGEVLDVISGKSRPKEEGIYPVYGGNGILSYANDFNQNESTLIVGRVGAYCGNIYLEKGNYWLSDNALGIKAKEDNSLIYFYYLLKDLQLNRNAIGGAQPLITQKIIKDLEVVIPSTYEEQVAIGQVLSSLDEKIELLEEENKTLETLAQTIFTEWFVNFNFPGATGEMEDSELGEIPKGWRVVELREKVELINGYAYKGKDLVNESNEALVTLKSFNRNGGFQTRGFKPFIGSPKLNQEVFVGDLIVAHTDLTQAADVLGNPAFIFENGGFERMFITMDLVKITSNELNIKFLYYLMKTARFKGHCVGYANGTTVLHLSKQAIPDYKVALPENLVIVNRFSELITPFIEKISNNILQIQTLKTTRDTLLPKLTTGEIRVDGFGE